MIQRKPIHRLGLNGPQEVKEHPWIKSYPWDKLINKQLEAPYVPNVNKIFLCLKMKFFFHKGQRR